MGEIVFGVGVKRGRLGVVVGYVKRFIFNFLIVIFRICLGFWYMKFRILRDEGIYLSYFVIYLIL